MITFKDISIIIPVGPSESALTVLLKDLRPIKKEAELIVVRGSSRAKQLNEGARKATRDFLWFLHADTRLREGAFERLTASLTRAPDGLHYFNLRFLGDGPALMGVNTIGAWIRSRLMGMPYGDQGFCLRKEVWAMLGGFPENTSYGEDHLLVWQARRHRVPLVCTKSLLWTSARKYQKHGWAMITLTYAARMTRQALPQWVALQKERLKR